jgi:hypothetical protein
VVSVTAVVLAVSATTGCYPRWLTASGQITKIENGDICVRQEGRADEDLCAHYRREEEVAGFRVGDCVSMRMYNESVRLHDARKIDCPSEGPP